MDIERLLSERGRSLGPSGIRRIFELAAKIKDPVNLSIGQPDFPVPDRIKDAAIAAIRDDHNGYTMTQGIATLRERIVGHLKRDLGWDTSIEPGAGGDRTRPGLLITSGTSGGLALATSAIVGDGDEVIMPDPYFVLYPKVVEVCGGRSVYCDTYPDFRMTAERVEPLITDRTKAIFVNSPSNPAGCVLTQRECDDLLDLCRRRGILLVSDEIYDEFTYSDARETTADGQELCPSPARNAGASDDVLVVRGFGKTYGLTGWRMGYTAGPSRLLEAMATLQQFTYVCPPSPFQWAVQEAFDVDMSPQVEQYRKRRDLVLDRLSSVTSVTRPGGAFYVFVEVPKHLGMTATEFVEQCIERHVLVIPGGVFSRQDTHFRVSYATDERSLERGMDILVDMLAG